jgi:hypothetical protein
MSGADDEILVCDGPDGSLSHVQAVVSCRSTRMGEGGGVVTLGGRTAVRAGRGVGMMSVVLGVKYNHVTIPAALAHICVSDALAGISLELSEISSCGCC